MQYSPFDTFSLPVFSEIRQEVPGEDSVREAAPGGGETPGPGARLHPAHHHRTLARQRTQDTALLPRPLPDPGCPAPPGGHEESCATHTEGVERVEVSARH